MKERLWIYGWLLLALLSISLYVGRCGPIFDFNPGRVGVAFTNGGYAAYYIDFADGQIIDTNGWHWVHFTEHGVKQGCRIWPKFHHVTLKYKDAYEYPARVHDEIHGRR